MAYPVHLVGEIVAIKTTKSFGMTMIKTMHGQRLGRGWCIRQSGQVMQAGDVSASYPVHAL